MFDVRTSAKRSTITRTCTVGKLLNGCLAESGSCLGTILPYRYTNARRYHRDVFRVSDGPNGSEAAVSDI